MNHQLTYANAKKGVEEFYEKNGFEEIQDLGLPKNFPKMPVDVKFYKYSN